jgi:hypothetical protein
VKEICHQIREEVTKMAEEVDIQHEVDNKSDKILESYCVTK